MSDIGEDMHSIQSTEFVKDNFTSALNDTFTNQETEIMEIIESTGKENIEDKDTTQALDDNHLQETHKRQEYCCNICKAIFTTKTVYTKHLMGEHGKILNSFGAWDKTRIDSSVINKTGVDTSKVNIYTSDSYCIVCRRMYSTKHTLANHMKRMHSRELDKFNQINDQTPTYRGNLETLYQCVKCNSRFEGNTSLQHHYLEAHKTPLKVVYPPAVLNITDTEEEMNLLSAIYEVYGPIFGSENTTQASPEDLLRHCHICSEKIENPEDYVNHILTMHEDSPSSLTKNIPDVLRYIDPLADGIDLDNVIYNENDPDFYCSLCDRKYKSDWCFMQHKRSKPHQKILGYKLPEITSANPLLYYCSVCNRGYDNKSSALEHAINNHTNSANTHIISGDRTQTISVPTNLSSTDPSRTESPEIDPSRTDKNMSMKKNNKEFEVFCGLCGQLFKELLQLRLHMEEQHDLKKYTTESPFYCSLCRIESGNEAFYGVHMGTKIHREAVLSAKERNLTGSGFSMNLDELNLIDYTDTMKHNCEICKTDYKGPLLYRYHLATVSHLINTFLSTLQVSSFETTQRALFLWSRHFDMIYIRSTKLKFRTRCQRYCNICNMEFTYILDSLCHLSSPIHKENCIKNNVMKTCESRQETCKDVQSQGTDSNQLETSAQLKNISHAKSDRELHCKLCDKSFRFPCHFKNHLVTRAHLKKKFSCGTSPNNAEVLDNDGIEYLDMFDSHSVLSEPEEPFLEDVVNRSYRYRVPSINSDSPSNHFLAPDLRQPAETTTVYNKSHETEQNIADNKNHGPSDTLFSNIESSSDHSLPSTVHEELVSDGSCKETVLNAGTLNDLTCNRQDQNSTDILAGKSAAPTNTSLQLTSTMERNNPAPTSSVASYYCQSCDVSFYSVNVLNSHLLTKDHKEKFVSATTVREDMNLTLQKIAEPHKTKDIFSFEPSSNCRTIRVNKNSRSVISKTTKSFDSNLHCDSCNKTFTNRHSSLMHFFKMHKSYYPDDSLETTPKRRLNVFTLLKDCIIPDPNNPKLFCKACRKRFNNRGNFKLHLKSKHNMVPSEDNDSEQNHDIVDSLAITNSQNPVGFYCKKCDKLYMNEHINCKHDSIQSSINSNRGDEQGQSTSSFQTILRSGQVKPYEVTKDCGSDVIQNQLISNSQRNSKSNKMTRKKDKNTDNFRFVPY